MLMKGLSCFSEQLRCDSCEGTDPGFPREDFVVKSWGSGKEFGLKGSELRTGYMVALEKGDVTILELTKIKKQKGLRKQRLVRWR